MDEELIEFTSFSVWDRTAENRGYYVTLNYKSNGKYKKKNKALQAETKREATREAASIFLEASENVSELIGNKLSLQEYFRQYLKTRETVRDVSKNTLSSYRYLCPSIVKGLENRAIEDITHKQVQEWVNREVEEGKLGSESIIKRINLLRALFEYAILHGDVKSNPVSRIRKPKRSHKEINVLSNPAIKQLIDSLNSCSDLPLRALVMVGITTGIRPGEACAIKWEDLNLKTGELNIHRTISRDRGTAFLSEHTKTKGSTRTIYVPEITLKCLRDVKVEQLALCSEAGTTWSEKLFILGTIDGMFLSPIWASKKWNNYAKALGIIGTTGDIPRLYDLRHTFATVAIKNGVDIETVSNSMGHTNVAMTLNTYATADPEAKKMLAKKMGDVFEW